MSRLLTQLATTPDLADVFDELFSARGSEPHLRDADEYVDLDAPVDAATLVAAASARGETFLGICGPRAEADDAQSVEVGPVRPRRGRPDHRARRPVDRSGLSRAERARVYPGRQPRARAEPLDEEVLCRTSTGLPLSPPRSRSSRSGHSGSRSRCSRECGSAPPGSPTTTPRAGACAHLRGAFVLIAISAILLAFLTDPLDFGGTLAASLAAGVGFALAPFWMLALFERKPFAYVAVNGGYLLVGFAVMGVILGAWK